MKITTSTYPRPGMGGFALIGQYQVDTLLSEENGLIKAEYNYNYRQRADGSTYYEQKAESFHFQTEREGFNALVTLSNEEFGTVIMLIEP